MLQYPHEIICKILSYLNADTHLDISYALFGINEYNRICCETLKESMHHISKINYLRLFRYKPFETKYSDPLFTFTHNCVNYTNSAFQWILDKHRICNTKCNIRVYGSRPEYLNGPQWYLCGTYAMI